LINNLKLIDSIDLDEFKKNIKDARESKKITIEQASKALHIEKNIIEMLEGGNFEAISIDIFVLGHIKTYLNWIGIDPKLLINNNKTENISLKQKKYKIVLPYSLKISKFYISVIALALFIIMLIIYNDINTLEIEDDIPNKNIEKDEALISKEQNSNLSQEKSKVKIYLNETNNQKEKVELEKTSQNLQIKVEYDNIYVSKIMKGNTILGVLKNVKWSIKEASEAANVFSTIYDPKRINTDMAIIFPIDRNIKVFALKINKKTTVVITKMKNGNFLAQKQSWEKAREIVSGSGGN
jgi:cytoskeletal protein RodZ